LGLVTAVGFRPGRQADDPPPQEVARLAVNRQDAQPGCATARTMAQLGDWARSALADIDQHVKDYSATFTKQERSEGQLGAEQVMFIKVRHHPFSVYLRFIAPPDRQGDEAIYVAGANNGNLLGHTTGLMGKLGTIPLPPTGIVAMYGQRHPITDTGIQHLTQLLLAGAERQMKNPACRVHCTSGVKLQDRVCQCVEVTVPKPNGARPGAAFIAKVFIDKQWNLPIRYEMYEWSGDTAEQPLLMELYAYSDLKLNNGFTDADFDKHNPSYNFP
jgi:hypothetical protein